MLRRVLVIAAACWLLAGCDDAKQDAEETGQGGQKAVGIAEKMKGGSVDSEATTDGGE